MLQPYSHTDLLSSFPATTTAADTPHVPIPPRLSSLYLRVVVQLLLRLKQVSRSIGTTPPYLFPVFSSLDPANSILSRHSLNVVYSCSSAPCHPQGT